MKIPLYGGKYDGHEADIEVGQRYVEIPDCVNCCATFFSDDPPKIELLPVIRYQVIYTADGRAFGNLDD